MQGPIKVIIRNNTDKLIGYALTPEIYIKPHDEFTLNYDPFTRHPNNTVTETMLIDAKLQRTQIVYVVDGEFITPTVGKDIAKLSRYAQRCIDVTKPEAWSKPIKNEEIKLPPPVPFGKTANDMVKEERAKLSEKEQEEIRKDEGLEKTIDMNDSTKPVSNVIEVSMGSDTAKEEAPVPEKTAEDTDDESTAYAVEEAPKKRGRKAKKEVGSL